MPFFDCFDHVMTRLAEIESLGGLPEDVELILANDGSVESKTYTMLEHCRTKYPFFRTVRFDVNRGFASINNLAARESEGDILCFLSDDVQILKPFWNEIKMEDLEKTFIGGRYITQDTGWNCWRTSIFPYLEGWCVICTRSAFEDVGGWDKNYDPHDYEDIDLSTTARAYSYKLKEFPKGNFKHSLGGTIGRKKSDTERLKVTQRNRLYFESKWVR